MRAKKFGGEVSGDKKMARLIKFGAVTDQVCTILYKLLYLNKTWVLFMLLVLVLNKSVQTFIFLNV